MKKTILTTITFILTLSCFSQTELQDKYNTADSLLQSGNLKQAYTLFKELESTCEPKDTLYEYILWYYTNAASSLAKEYRMQEKFDSALTTELVASELIEKGIPIFGDLFIVRKYWMHKNMVVNYFGLNDLKKAEQHKKILYEAYEKKQLPDGLDEYFNFDFFTHENKNIWGYEWLEELPEDRFSRSFSKVVYYVYSTNKDGTDKDLLYRLHVVMFHNSNPKKMGFDYVLTKHVDTARGEAAGTLYSYTYLEDIDYSKLKSDVKKVLNGDLGYQKIAKSKKKKKKK